MAEIRKFSDLKEGELKKLAQKAQEQGLPEGFQGDIINVPSEEVQIKELEREANEFESQAGQRYFIRNGIASIRDEEFTFGVIARNRKQCEDREPSKFQILSGTRPSRDGEERPFIQLRVAR